jgi:hypothetical protein
VYVLGKTVSKKRQAEDVLEVDENEEEYDPPDVPEVNEDEEEYDPPNVPEEVEEEQEEDLPTDVPEVHEAGLDVDEAGPDVDNEPDVEDEPLEIPERRVRCRGRTKQKKRCGVKQNVRVAPGARWDCGRHGS